jgi:hypothetical protein
MKKISTISLILGCLGLSLYAQVPTASLVGHWPFSGNPNDFSGNNNNGIVSNAVLSCDRCGNPNSAYYFNGTNAMIRVPHDPSIDMNNNDFSISFWIKAFLPPVNDAMPLSKNQWGSWSSYQFLTNNTNPGYCTTAGQISFYTASGAGQDACSNGPIAAGTATTEACLNGWTHVVGVWDNATGQSYLFINGVQQADIGGMSGNLSNTVDLAFGAHPNNALWFYGSIDDIRIYKTKLSQPDINALYAESCTTTKINETGINEIEANLYPNPAFGNIKISATSKIREVKIVNAIGDDVMKKDGEGNMEMELNTSMIAQGVYYARVRSEVGNKVIKFIKMN